MTIPTLRGLDHVALTVPDLEQAIALFQRHFGARHVFTTRSVPDPGFARERLDVPGDAWARIAMLRLDERTNLELFEYTVGDQRVSWPRNSDVGGSHLAFYVDDIDAAVAHLAQDPDVTVLGGVTRIEDDPAFGGLALAYVRLPWGGYVELVSSPDGLSYTATTADRLAPPPAPPADTWSA